MNAASLMRRAHPASSGMSLVEFAIASSIFAVVLLAGYASWEMAWKGMRDENNATTAYEGAFGALYSMAEQIQVANTVQIPDPDNTGVPSIQLLVNPMWNTSLGNSSYGGSVRRAYRLSGSNLIMEWKDENGDAVSTIYSGVSSLTFTMLDSPNNTEVQIALSATEGNRTVSMQTVAWKRN